jgi:hypothetical protein
MVFGIVHVVNGCRVVAALHASTRVLTTRIETEDFLPRSSWPFPFHSVI